MRIIMRQALRGVMGHDYAAGEAVDLPPQTALQLVRRGVADLAPQPERAKTATENRIKRSKANRLKMPGENRGASR